MSISENILEALASFPDGEALVSDVRKMVIERESTPSDLARRMREAAERGVLRRALPLDQQGLNVFSQGFVERPRPGVWRITSAGRQYLADRQRLAVHGARSE